jgi:hypothetical protein
MNDYSHLKHFSIEEFDFPSSHGYPAVSASGLMDMEFLTLLDQARERCGFPFIITSGYRPDEYDEQFFNISNSDHAMGCGADILINIHDCFMIFHVLESLFYFGFSRIGINPNGHIHVGGKNPTKPSNVFWLE